MCIPPRLLPPVKLSSSQLIGLGEETMDRERGSRRRTKSNKQHPTRPMMLTLLFFITPFEQPQGRGKWYGAASAYCPLLQPRMMVRQSAAVRERNSDDLTRLWKKTSNPLWTMETFPPSMFVKSAFSTAHNNIQTLPFAPSSRVFDFEELSKTTTTRTPVSLRNGVSRTKGALGFQIGDNDSSAVSRNHIHHVHSATRLQAHNRMGGRNGSGQNSRPVSNVDSTAWNLPEPLSLEAAGAYGGTTRRHVEGNRRSLTTTTTAVPAATTVPTSTTPTSIPWIASSDEIDSLTVLQLKEELGARALKKTGNKAELQDRIKEWTLDQERRQRLLARDASQGGDLTSLNLALAYGGGSSTTSATPNFENELLSWGIDSSSFLAAAEPTEQPKRLEYDSLAEWARTVDLEPLLHRREAIHREKLEGKPKKKVQRDPSILPSDYLSVLKKMFDKPSSPYSNREVKQMYAAAKHADQVGDRQLSKRILLELKKATPNDARIFRRLSRMENEEGNVAAARAVLQEGLALHSENAFLWHGLGQLEGSIGDEVLQKKHWEKAIEVDPSLPHSYHALGTLEHTQGRVANAMKILKKGIEYCPTNHRLHHALGDLYRDAKMLSMAASSYQKVLKHGPYVSHGFAYTALAYVAYEEGQVDQCRNWLHKAVRLNNGRHANGWVALAQFEESEGNIDAARSACLAGIGQYERGLLERSRNIKFQEKTGDERAFLEDPVALKNKFLKTVPSYRSGDRFFNVYRNWFRLEERYGNIDAVEEVYERASVAFPREWKLALDAAQYHVKLDIQGRARKHFAEACARASSCHADAYRLFAEFEMSNDNFAEARKILYSGAMVLSKDSFDGDPGDHRGLAELFLTWAVCEWRLNNLFQAGKLFNHALELTMPAEELSSLRSFILYAMARFEYFRGEYRRAHHFTGRCLKENLMPGGNSVVWDLWAAVAHETGDEKLAYQCQEQAVQVRTVEMYSEGDPSALSQMLQSRTKGPKMQELMRRDPWHRKLFGNGSTHNFLSSSLLPEREQMDMFR